MGRRHMFDQACELHHQLPEAPPPPNPPPPPLKPPPPPKPPPPKPPPRPPPKPPPRRLPVDQLRVDPINIANRKATTPAPRPIGKKWLKAQARPPARPPVATEPNRRPNSARSTPLTTNT